MKNKTLLFIILGIGYALAFTSCEKPDSEIEWGFAKIYMPQANYAPYITTTEQPGATCRIDQTNNELKIYLGVYRSGLQELKEFSVDVVAEPGQVENAVDLPASVYTLPAQVTCPDGNRDVTFYLKVDLAFLQENIDTDYTIAVAIQNPTNYELNEDLSTTQILIKPSELLN
jgi:hypothetical protein